MPKKIKCFIIHLGSACERESQVGSIAAATPFETDIVDAEESGTVDASVYRPGLHKPAYPFSMRMTEIACFESHRRAWRSIIDAGCDAGLIVEDDVAFDEPAFSSALELALKHLTAEDYIRFPIKSREQAGEVIEQTRDGTLIRPRIVGLGCCCQLVGRGAAERLLAASVEIDRPVDCFVQMQWVTNVNPLSVAPSGVREVSGEIGGSLIHQRIDSRSLPRTIIREVRRFLYRSRLRRHARSPGR